VSEPRARHLEIQATDGLLLPALFFEPVRRSREAAIFLHGNGDSSVFYSVARMNAFARALNAKGIAFLTFNNRGAHLSRRLKSGKSGRVSPGGTTFERIAESVRDINGAVESLESLGYRSFDLIGHSTGANKVCHYFWKMKERAIIRRVVLIAGGDDMGLYYDSLGPLRFEKLLSRARERVADGRGLELAPRRTGPFPLSWRALLDTIRPEGQYNVFPFYEKLHAMRLTRGKKPFREFASISAPVFAIYGSADEYCFNRVTDCVEILKDSAAGKDNFHFSILEGASHGFGGYEAFLARRVARFLAL